ncbi:trehalase [Flavobacterium franklandianum]|uniref:Trehalase n=1 Tax=Flavobacterium franklandianum TaxID=2594430 RepID=A0A553CUC5_9FLAO|nr:trehalase family glycosidase [Flavobacterium franklandianum]TRX24024.1 trehalase [Flavobacterium franklandianum]TRX25359.1 trehalase [Flavobacterium franklandianum]
MKFKLNINQTLQQLLKQEDTDKDKRITVDDKGPKRFILKSPSEEIVIEGTYYLSNLLQELVLAKENNQDFIETESLFQLPADRISKMIRKYFWDGLTRTLDEKGLEKLLLDSKSKTDKPIIYIPFTDNFGWQYFRKLAPIFNLKVVQLPKIISSEYVSSINNEGGILALALKKEDQNIEGFPFVVPGARFNEMYGWDSYFENIGLLIDQKLDLAQSMVENFEYQITHYGKILNANRSYYLTRTQPPFYSSMIREVYEAMTVKDQEWLRKKLEICIKEYETVWMENGKRLAENGLNRYFAQGIGLPPETEPGHYDAILKPFAEAENLSISEYENLYYHRKIENKTLDAYFVHDRSVRESGHDTSYRIEGNCAHLNVVELNAMLYKYETDFAELIALYFDNYFEYNSKIYNKKYWAKKAESRKKIMNRLLWNEQESCFFDYNFKTQKQNIFLSATSFFPLWAKIATQEQADKMIEKCLPKLVFLGGIAGCSEEALSTISKGQMQRQWDFPNGWPPHQMVIWRGLINYGYEGKAQELIYRWLWTITKNASDYNGTVPEKFDVVSASHKVFAEYGNQGTDFEYISREGFGWMNASFQLGLSLLNEDLKTKLNQLINPIELFN